MGYYTSYGLSVGGVKDPSIYGLIDNEIQKMNVFDSDGIKHGLSAYAKWYDCHNDMLLLSAKFPEVIFRLEGVGEDAEDRWMSYYKGGRSMTDCLEVKVNYKEFDEQKLEGEAVKDTGQKYSYQMEVQT